MDPTTGPKDYHRLEGARSIELYANPTPTSVLYVPTASDWGYLSGASSGGALVPIEVTKAHLRYPRGRHYEDREGNSTAQPDITPELTHSGGSAVRLLEEWGRDPERYCDPNIYLWRMRVTEEDGRAVEWCFRAYVFGLSHHYVPGKVYGVFGVIDPQPLIVEAGSPAPRAAAR